MKILVLNAGSSSIKYQLFNITKKEQIVIDKGIYEEVKNFDETIKTIIQTYSNIDIYGHRVVHGGDKFYQPTLINDEVIQNIKDISHFAPLHNKANLNGIIAIKKLYPDAQQVAIFDTAFHHTIPKKSHLYPLPYKFYEKHKIRRYGFHGTSHSYVAKQCAKKLNKPLENLNLITIHLGNGASMCAIQNGISIDTSMGLTPLEGLMMGTRCGDIDPAIIFYMQNNLNLTIKEIENILNKKSGLLGISEKSSDLREVINFAQKGDDKSQLALEIFAYKVQKYIGSYMFVLDKVDAVVFTGGIGENSPFMRDMILKDKTLNTKVMVIPTNEELEIAMLTYEIAKSRD